ESKTQSYDRDYAEEALKTFNQKSALSDTRAGDHISDGDLCQSSRDVPLLRSQETEKGSTDPRIRLSHELGAGIRAADDKHQPLFKAFK
ncbi:uncharacterized, partial [Tachysurus ichikawai]